MNKPDAAHEHNLLREILNHLRVVHGPDSRGEYIAWCAFHPDGRGIPPHKPNLNISQRGFCCHACGAKGSLEQLAEKLGVQTKAAGKEPEAIYD